MEEGLKDMKQFLGEFKQTIGTLCIQTIYWHAFSSDDLLARLFFTPGPFLSLKCVQHGIRRSGGECADDYWK